jgi:copper(I)-binding protein
MKPLTLLALGAALALGACQQQAEKPADPSPDAKPGLSLADGRLVLPAVSGNPGAGYFTLTNNGEKAATLAAVFIDGAEKAEMHETKESSMAPLPKLELKAGETVRFEPGGKHVMAFGLKPGLAAGGSVEITLTFADGDKLSAPLAIAAPGGGMDHGAAH